MDDSELLKNISIAREEVESQIKNLLRSKASIDVAMAAQHPDKAQPFLQLIQEVLDIIKKMQDLHNELRDREIILRNEISKKKTFSKKNVKNALKTIRKYGSLKEEVIDLLNHQEELVKKAPLWKINI